MSSLWGCLPKGGRLLSEGTVTSFWSTVITRKPKSQPMASLPCCKHHRRNLFATWHVSFPSCARECFQLLSWKVNHFHVAHYLIEMPEVIAQLSVGMEKAEEGRQSKTHRANKWCAEHTAWKPLALLMSGQWLGKRRGRGKQARMATSVNSLLVDILIVFSGLK